MTWSAWLLLGVTWTIIAYFTGRFFLGVLRATEESEGNDEY
ncbi:MAG: hypothetical protein OEY20_05975 [Gemmatimonadota bacterium]|nr:hypothetical protein [Gemmatimonadota bacterium]MDH5196779.1 hypothetical protein [Gemmatimonadota bacterium]